MCGWIGNGILARAPIRPNSAWKALGVIGPSRSVMKTCEDAPPRRCLSARLAQRCGSPNPLRTAPGSETARATTSRTDLCVASSTREARQSAINWSRSNIVLIRQCLWTAELVRGAHCHAPLWAVHPSFSSPSRRAVMRACPSASSAVNIIMRGAHPPRLLRARRERAGCRRGADQRDERAPFHQQFLPCFEAEDSTAGDLLHCGILKEYLSARGHSRHSRHPGASGSPQERTFGQ